MLLSLAIPLTALISDEADIRIPLSPTNIARIDSIDKANFYVSGEDSDAASANRNGLRWRSFDPTDENEAYLEGWVIGETPSDLVATQTLRLSSPWTLIFTPG